MRLVLVGIGHVNIGILARAEEVIAEGHEVLVIHPGPVQYYSGMGPGMVGGSYEPEEVRFPVAFLAKKAGARFLDDRVVSVDPGRREVVVSGGERFAYDVLSLNLGSTTTESFALDRGAEGELPSMYASKPISRLVELRREIERRREREALEIVVIGGGPAAVELGANCARLLEGSSGRVTMIAGRTLLAGFPRRAARLALRELRRLGITVRTNERALRIAPGEVVTGQGAYRAHLVVGATGVTPVVPRDPSGLPIGPDGGLAVTERLNILDYPNIFCGGDCISFIPRRLDRVGVYAVRETPVLVNNVFARLRGQDRQLRTFSPQRHYLLLLNLGGRRALLSRKILGLNMVLYGRWVWRLKDRIDRSFMKEYGSESYWHQVHTTF